jgi:hypothetical protein
MCVKCRQAVFLSGIRRTDFEEIRLTIVKTTKHPHMNKLNVMQKTLALIIDE